jgi:hypothetical protein
MSVTFAALTRVVDSQVARMNRAVCVQQVSCVIFASGPRGVAVAVGGELGPGPPPPPPRKMNPTTPTANTQATATTVICATRSARVYRMR